MFDILVFSNESLDTMKIFKQNEKLFKDQYIEHLRKSCHLDASDQPFNPNYIDELYNEIGQEDCNEDDINDKMRCYMLMHVKYMDTLEKQEEYISTIRKIQDLGKSHMDMDGFIDTIRKVWKKISTQ